MLRIDHLKIKNKTLANKVDKLTDSIEVLAKRECSDLAALLRSASKVFKSTDTGLLNSQTEKNVERLKFIAYLHDFKNI
jgi:hypothetical protein